MQKNTSARHPEAGTIVELNAPRILIVEDDASYAIKLMNDLKDWQMPLTKGGCTVDVVDNISQARDYLLNDIIDIFMVDLIMKEDDESDEEGEEAGKDFVREVVARTNAGIIVHSSISSDREAANLLNEGADDYIQKYVTQEDIRARILALWRRIQLIRPGKKSDFVHTNRVFLIGDWNFTVGNRTLTNSSGEAVRLSHTEHAFLRHICSAENNECDKVSFNLYVLGRRHFERNNRIDNFVYRLRKKLGEKIQLISDDGSYKLLDVREIKAIAA